jgi:hypothetical protein
MKLKYEKSAISLCCLLPAEQHTVNLDRAGYELLIDRSLADGRSMGIYLTCRTASSREMLADVVKGSLRRVCEE